MSYKEELYKNALTLIDHIYESSKYNEEVDLFRIHDVINSLNDNQMKSKEWLVDTILEYIDTDKIESIMIAGSWYGLTSVILKNKLNKDVLIRNVDCDTSSENIGRTLYKHNNIEYVVDDALEHFLGRMHKYDLIVNTSCEHMEKEDIRYFVEGKRPDTILCFQANDYHQVQSHINTYNNLEEFVDHLSLNEVLYAEALPINNGQNERYMVIGK